MMTIYPTAAGASSAPAVQNYAYKENWKSTAGCDSLPVL